ncbi:MAG: AAC(3) family N-acetyltransferase [Oscillospiraceae bacterium]|nr:AAC(3) family N-acetyltransferase [Oscillospiraceae bacterium]
MFTKDDLKKQLSEIGIKSSDTVMIHTSMRAVGEVENGADGLIDAFSEYLSDGLFLVPTHTWDSVYKDKPIFDSRTAVPCIGAVPKTAAQRSDGIRSLHPTHSIWAKGKNAEEYVKGEEKAQSPAPVGFAWDRLADVNAKILLIGVGNDKNTFIHSIDERADIPDRLGEPYDTVLIDADGNEIKGVMRGHKCSRTNDVSKFYVNFEPALVSSGAQTFGKLGNAEVRVVDAKKCREVIMKILSRAKEDLCVSYTEIPKEYYM